jgi:hypothetical protein
LTGAPVNEFDWAIDTAHRYISIARAVESRTLPSNIARLTIDATALYALAAPDVPQAARDLGSQTSLAGPMRPHESICALPKSFKNQPDWDLGSLTIDATALYALAAPGVPQAARDEVIEPRVRT